MLLREIVGQYSRRIHFCGYLTDNHLRFRNGRAYRIMPDHRFRYMDNAPFPGTQPVAGPAGKKCDNRTKQHMANLPSHRPFF